MKNPHHIPERNSETGAAGEAVETACGRIAPTWPLDQFIAVNPYWGFRGESVRQVAQSLESYSGSHMVMPRSYYRERWNARSLRPEHIEEALRRCGARLSLKEVREELEREAPSAPRIPLMTTIADSTRDLLHGMSLDDFVKHNISQHCASYFDHSQSSWDTQHKKNLFHSWLRHASADRSPWLLMGLHDVRSHARSLPSEPLAMIEVGLQRLPVPKEGWADYLTALLMNMNGWASWCAFERWQAALAEREDDHIVQLLAIRLAWEHYAFLHLLGSKEPTAWTMGWERLRAWRQEGRAEASVDWIFQEALEIAYQSDLCAALRSNFPTAAAEDASAPQVQAVFCIDVRSEVFRRALEQCSSSIQTLGFAGFFGLPICYTPLGTSAERPQLPGLLAPTLRVSESTGSKKTDDQIRSQRQRSLGLRFSWKEFRSSASSMFTFVESCGLFYVICLLKSTLPKLMLKGKASDGTRVQHASLRPCLLNGVDNDTASVEALCDLAAGILRNMSLTKGFARLLVLTGHGSETANNPHAAGLDCGACGGQTGEVNARVLAGLLNDAGIRAGLEARGIVIPETTYVLAALHNTTVDEVTVFDTDLLPESHAGDLLRLKSWLKQAGHRARMERAAGVGMEADGATSDQALLDQFRVRSRNWSEVRPEWGLVNNAAFLVAPRMRSRGLDLAGRVFLHEYESLRDANGSILEAIMTAPMLVTNWINMQYYASTVDNRQYGSGNKLLHNVVGGRLGVFEGNGGDLRIGLPLQSLHDGHSLRHTPLRLSVFIEAPQSSIGAVIVKHKVVGDLIHNGWLHLFQIAPEEGTISRYRDGIWEPMEVRELRAAEETVDQREIYA
ncbi:MAG: YbcC family protein [Acidobacteriaceae bacterium]